MPYSAKIICDSINLAGHRLTTMEISYPRFVHAAFTRHRMFSLSVGSSRAIPTNKLIDKTVEPVMPIWWGKNQPGMSAEEELNEEEIKEASQIIEWMLASVTYGVEELAKIGLHKQITNRYLEPWLWVTHLVTGTEPAYANFFALRCHPDAQPEIAKIAYMMKEIYLEGKPEGVRWGGWHLPYIANDEVLNREAAAMISAARCARVSYLTQDGKRDIEKDIELYQRLVGQVPRHCSPLEHVAYACYHEVLPDCKWNIGCEKCDKSNFAGSGWHQLRKDLPDEYITEIK